MLNIYSKNIVKNIQNFIDQNLYKITPIESYDFFNTGVYCYGHKIVPCNDGDRKSYILHSEGFVRYYDYKNNCENEWCKQNFREMPLIKYLGKDIKKQTVFYNDILPYVELNSFYNDPAKNYKDLKIKAILRCVPENDDSIDLSLCLNINGVYYIIVKLTLQDSAYNQKDMFEIDLTEADMEQTDLPDEEDEEDNDILLSDIANTVIDSEPLF